MTQVANAIVAIVVGANFPSKLFLIPRKVSKEPPVTFMNRTGLLYFV